VRNFQDFRTLERMLKTEAESTLTNALAINPRKDH